MNIPFLLKSRQPGASWYYVQTAIIKEYIGGIIMRYGQSAPQEIKAYIKQYLKGTQDPEYLIRVINTYYPQYNELLQKYLILK